MHLCQSLIFGFWQSQKNDDTCQETKGCIHEKESRIIQDFQCDKVEFGVEKVEYPDETNADGDGNGFVSIRRENLTQNNKGKASKAQSEAEVE